jgi:hypothetical protein
VPARKTVAKRCVCSFVVRALRGDQADAAATLSPAREFPQSSIRKSAAL